MSDLPHSRAWYARLGREQSVYAHPWRRVLSGPDPEETFDGLLASLLTPQAQVLEAGCGHGPDAARFGARAARWVAYDFVPEWVAAAQANAPHAEVHLWDGRGEVPAPLYGPFDLIVSRRGPTSVIRHLPALAAPDARFLYVGPRLDVPQVPAELEAAGWQVLGEWRASVLAHAPTRADWQRRCEWMDEPGRVAEWETQARAAGLPYREERYTVLAAPA